MKTSSVAPGQIITFYSYKGGTGRSMALANVGFLLAQQQSQNNGRGVLLVDWDLEAPGLHRFLRNAFRGRFGASRDSETQLDQHPGLIDLFDRLRDASRGLPEGAVEVSDQAEAELRDGIDLGRFVLKTDIEKLFFLKAGRFDRDYSALINGFDWEGLYKRAPWLLPWFGNLLAERFDYVLIDSRTGLTDTSGICTALLPEKLVIVFTPNLQSTEGAIGVVERATEYRRRSDDLRPLVVFPLPSRIEDSSESLRDHWRFDRAIGYQPRFEELFQRVYGLPRCDLTPYFDEIQIQHVPEYAYGEEIAAMVERGDRLSLTRGYLKFTDWLLRSAGPWEPPDSGDSRSPGSDLNRLAFTLIAQMGPDETVLAKRALLRLVHIGPEGQSGSDIGVRVNKGDFPGSAPSILPKLVSAGILRAEDRQDGSEVEIEFADDAMIETWTQLKNWIEEDRPFLAWRQRLDDNIAQWRAREFAKDFLLRGLALREAQSMLGERLDDLNEWERDYIAMSTRAENRRSAFRDYGIAAAVILLYFAWFWMQSREGPFSVAAISMVDSRIGWAAGASDDRGLILVTKDGGTSWTEESIDCRPHSLYFYDAAVGWVAGDNGICVTSDGGTTWTQRASLNLNDIFFIDRLRGWAVGDKGLLMASVNGGEKWEAQTSGVDATLRSVHFSGAQHGVSVGKGGIILSTFDGGRAWSRGIISAWIEGIISREQDPENFNFQSVHLTGPKSGWVVGYEAKDNPLTIERNVILKTQDGGRNWIRQRLGSDQQPARCCFWDVYFLDERIGWVVGTRTVLKTTDGGATWKLAAEVDYLLKSVHFLDARTGWATTDNAILSTLDGGTSWNQIWPKPD